MNSHYPAGTTRADIEAWEGVECVNCTASLDLRRVRQLRKDGLAMLCPPCAGEVTCRECGDELDSQRIDECRRQRLPQECEGCTAERKAHDPRVA